MKTMQLDDKVVRVKEELVEKKLADGWKFVPKSVWKEKVRDVEKVVEDKKPTKTKKNKMSKATKRQLKQNKS
jgi:hypothetical protein